MKTNLISSVQYILYWQPMSVSSTDIFIVTVHFRKTISHINGNWCNHFETTYKICSARVWNEWKFCWPCNEVFVHCAPQVHYSEMIIRVSLISTVFWNCISQPLEFLDFPVPLWNVYCFCIDSVIVSTLLSVNVC